MIFFVNLTWAGVIWEEEILIKGLSGSIRLPVGKTMGHSLDFLITD